MIIRDRCLGFGDRLAREAFILPVQIGLCSRKCRKKKLILHVVLRKSDRGYKSTALRHAKLQLRESYENITLYEAKQRRRLNKAIDAI